MGEFFPISETARAGFDAAPGRSRTLPGHVYTSAETFEREKREIHFKAWHYAGALRELRNPGDFITAGILDQGIFIIRSRDGRLRGFYNVCQHRAHELLQGRGNAPVVTCPYHAWSYHTDGALRSARGAERLDGFDAARFCLKPVQVEVFAGKFVFFNLDPAARPLREEAGDLEAELRSEIPGFDGLEPAPPAPSRMIRANWKIPVENYLECYHCGPAHPAFVDLIDMRGYRIVTHGIWSSQKGKLGHAAHKAYPVPPEAAVQGGLFWWLWPTTVFSVLPGAANLSASSFLPAALDSTERRDQNFALPGAVPDERRTAYLRTILGPEDIAICESVQRGLSSRGYGAGRFAYDPENGPASEHAVHHFQRLLATALALDS